MPFKLRFHELALKEWHALDKIVQEQLKKKLRQRLEQPDIPSAALSDMPNCYKIKLLKAGCRLVYRVDRDNVFVTVIAIGRRDKSEVYKAATKRL
ncbi:MAG: type II toxin-antitoxin system RelE/ParE family toxin [Deltaproteobacteria bacterium]|jgi:mRNA interferase RelE/StbE|nr:type II toxin-antitoxin system RelE/ParE family toxin [Deltaproteobacteria bacterium]